MDDFYSSLPVIPDPKHGLDLLSTDLETLQFPTLCTELDHEQLLALDDPHSFYLAFPDAGVFGTRDEAFSRASSAVTPLSECSTRTAFSTRNISPTSEILSFPDNPTPKDIEAMFHDTTQSIVSGRQSRAASASWPSTNSNSTGLNVTLTPPTRPIPHRPQSFSYKTPQITHQGGKTPPPPSSFFPSPNLQPQSAARSPFLTPTAASPMPSQMPQISTPTGFVQGSMTHNPSSYFAQLQSQPPPSQQQLTQIAHQQQFQQQMQLQQQQQILALRQSVPQQQAIPAQFQNQVLGMNHISALFPGAPQPALNSLTPTTTNPTQTPTLPNTIGNSSTGYQCFSHGCGGRHFSNWGNLVRHHRERQLRSKAGAKPACPRCGKGFTRSSARDAHVAGLKCVLGRRRRGTTATAAAGGVKVADGEAAGQSASGTCSKDEADDENDASSDGSREDDNADVDADASEGKDDEGDEVGIMGLYGVRDEDDGFDLDLNPSSGGQSYLAPQQLQFDH